MLDDFKALTQNQYGAAISTLARAVHTCSDAQWSAPIAKLDFCQAAFHALFFADLYLDESQASMREQPFHIQHVSAFRDYEELQDRKPVHAYEKPFILAYARHVHEKALRIVGAETVDSLRAAAPFSWVDMRRAELHVYTIRHLQHHASQMILRLRLDGPIEFPWHKSGWQEDWAS